MAARCSEFDGFGVPKREVRFLPLLAHCTRLAFIAGDYGLIRKDGHWRDVLIFLRICTGYFIPMSVQNCSTCTERDAGDEPGRQNRRLCKWFRQGKPDDTATLQSNQMEPLLEGAEPGSEIPKSRW